MAESYLLLINGVDRLLLVDGIDSLLLIASPEPEDTPEGLDGNIVRAVSFEVHIG